MNMSQTKMNDKSDFFKKVHCKLDRQMHPGKRKILLFVDHAQAVHLKLQLDFLPTNCTGKVQVCRLGIT